jgi:glycopeptide antibiotics resistance protein
LRRQNNEKGCQARRPEITMHNSNRSSRLTTTLFIIYLIAVCWIVVFKFNLSFPDHGNQRRFNPIPYYEPLRPNGQLDYGEIIMNVLFFVPLGIYVGALFGRWHFANKLLLFFLVSLLCETTQLIMHIGAFDITDLINNTLGGVMGLLLFMGMDKLLKNPVRTQHVVNLLGLSGSILLAAFVLLLKIFHLWIFRMS